MLQKFKIAFYAIIVWLVLPSQAVAENPHLGGIPAAASCAGSDCSQNPNRQLCLKGTPGAERKHKICMYERGHRWVPAGGGTRTRADRALSWEQQNASAPPPPPAAPPTAAPHMPPGAPGGPPPGAPPTAAAQTGNPHLNGIPAAASCGGWDCSQNPNRQLCLKGTSGAKREHYICMHERDNKWIAAAGGTKTRADKALAWEKQTGEADSSRTSDLGSAFDAPVLRRGLAQVGGAIAGTINNIQEKSKAIINHPLYAVCMNYEKCANPPDKCRTTERGSKSQQLAPIKNVNRCPDITVQPTEEAIEAGASKDGWIRLHEIATQEEWNKKEYGKSVSDRFGDHPLGCFIASRMKHEKSSISFKTDQQIGCCQRTFTHLTEQVWVDGMEDGGNLGTGVTNHKLCDWYYERFRMSTEERKDTLKFRSR